MAATLLGLGLAGYATASSRPGLRGSLTHLVGPASEDANALQVEPASEDGNALQVEPASEDVALEGVNALQWNPHWKTSMNAGDKVTADLTKFLADDNVDFANMVEYTDRGASTVQGNKPALGKYTMIDNNKDGQDVCSQDKTTLLYDSTKWTPTGEAEMGCLDGDDRAYIAQTFTSSSSSEKIVVAGAHWPHRDVADQMKQAIDALGCTGCKVLFVGDTNLNVPYATSQISEKMGLGTVGSGAQGSDEGFLSCCSNDPGYIYNYDRIIANFGSAGETKYPLGNQGMASKPAYVTDDGWEFHLPVAYKITI